MLKGCYKKWFRIPCYRALLVTQIVKNLPAMSETWVRSLDQEDLLEKGIATHSSILAWKIPWTEEAGWLQSVELQRIGYNWSANTHTHHDITYKWNLKCVFLVAQSCLILCDPMDCSQPGSCDHGVSPARILDGLPCLTPGDLPNPGIEPRSPTLQADSLLSEPLGKLRV